ncbi:hypothetical protein B0H67DRAFT_558031 [Lasiosphaeris hirsuta]|uniref:Uncharacterized protein n=1 Tax=Lasiosphaeris hirsuta TaxID=260670 RepID=A0AA39ZXE5_9PEZI|nr:hypothetical protein B0H67DRAFT_558031 [Lasiosphaeris hirsuta]
MHMNEDTNFKFRLAVTTMLLVFQAAIFTFDLLVSAIRSVLTVSIHIEYSGRNVKLSAEDCRQWWNFLQQLTAPVLFGFLGYVLIPIMVASNSRDRSHKCSNNTDAESYQLDADIGGDGIRIATWVQEIVLILVAIVGTFHSLATGAKEIGAGLAVTHTSLVCALLVQMVRNELSAADAIMGSMILDSQSNALSIQLTSKETLAARWQVCAIVLPCQVFGLIALPIIVHGFTKGDYPAIRPDHPVGLSCFKVFWWSWMDSCGGSSPKELSIFWAYYAYRCLAFAQCCYHSVRDTGRFHVAEKYRKPLDEITYPRLSLGQRPAALPPQRPQSEGDLPAESQSIPSEYGQYPATVTLMYMIHGFFALASLAAAETAFKEVDICPSSGFTSIGQIIAIVVASATIIRGLFLFVKMFVAREGIVNPFQVSWPLSLGAAKRLFKFGHRSTYHMTPEFRDVLMMGAQPMDSDNGSGTTNYNIKLGSILRSATDIDELEAITGRKNHPKTWQTISGKGAAFLWMN